MIGIKTIYIFVYLVIEGIDSIRLHELSEKKLASHVALPVAIAAVSFSAIFVRLSGASSTAIAFYRMLFSTLIVSIFVPKYLDELRKISRRDWLILLSAGFFMAIHFVAWISSLDYTSVASSVVLVTSHPLLVAWISSHYLGEKTSRKAYIAIVIALFGIGIMAVSDYHFEEWSLFGDFLAILGMVAVTGYIIRTKQMRRKMSVIPYVFTVYGFSTLFLGGFSMFLATPFKIYPMQEYLLFLALAIIPTILGHTLYNWAIKYIKTRIASVSLLGEPIGASILALLILNEVPPVWTILGAGIALVGIYFCARFE